MVIKAVISEYRHVLALPYSLDKLGLGKFKEILLDWIKKRIIKSVVRLKI